MEMLNETEVSISDIPLGAFGDEDNYEDEQVEDDDEVDDEVTEVPASQVVKKKRAMNYTEVEDTTLCRAWSTIGIDACTGSDQTGKRYWQRIEDQFLKMMPRVKPVVYRSD